jgi:hypothetical protein
MTYLTKSDTLKVSGATIYCVPARDQPVQTKELTDPGQMVRYRQCVIFAFDAELPAGLTSVPARPTVAVA